jgi:hypothetical protein
MSRDVTLTIYRVALEVTLDWDKERANLPVHHASRVVFSKSPKPQFSGAGQSTENLQL